MFERLAQQKPEEEILEDAVDARDLEPDEFITRLLRGVCAQADRLDEVITRHIKGWKLQRLSRVTHAILQLSVYEILCEPDIPVSVSINEAVELAKQYGTSDDAAYINGVLSAVEKSESYDKQED